MDSIFQANMLRQRISLYLTGTIQRSPMRTQSFDNREVYHFLQPYKLSTAFFDRS
jgi:hypothetical protein